MICRHTKRVAMWSRVFCRVLLQKRMTCVVTLPCSPVCLSVCPSVRPSVHGPPPLQKKNDFWVAFAILSNFHYSIFSKFFSIFFCTPKSSSTFAFLLFYAHLLPARRDAMLPSILLCVLSRQHIEIENVQTPEKVFGRFLTGQKLKTDPDAVIVFC